MTSLFCRFKPEILLPLLLAATLGEVLSALRLIPEAAAWLGTGITSAAAIGLGLYFWQLRKVSDAVQRTCKAIRNGDFESRIVIPGLRGEPLRIADDVNAMVDVNDAFVRESALTMAAAAEGRSYRKICPEGLNGAFLQAAEKINEAVDGLAERPALMGQLESSFGTVVQAAIAGDFSRRIETRFPDPALNRLAAGINDLVATVDRGLTETGTVLSAVARADLRLRVTGDFQGAFAVLKESVNEVAANLESVVGGIIDASQKLKSSQADILADAQNLADRTNISATAVEETSAAMEEISVTTAENARKASSGTERADKVAGSIEDVRHSMVEADTAVRQIQSASEEIEGIVSLIDSIAFQTRLLALNASVEAARAGEAGRGFAVVASEVRNLAERVVSSSREIKGLVEQSGGQVRQGTVLVAKAGTQLAEILELIRQNAADMKEIAVACGEQANAVAEISTAVAQLEDSTSQNATLVDRTSSQLRASEGELGRLDTLVRRFMLNQTSAATERQAEMRREFTAALSEPEPVNTSADPANVYAPVHASAGNVALNPDDWSEF
jgi:methyl-accepting chemotaxis protein